MSRDDRRGGLRRQVRAQMAESKDWPHGFRPGNLAFWPEPNHVLTIRCGQCYRPAFLVLARVGYDTVDSILRHAELIAADGVVADPCACYWDTWPDVKQYRPQVSRAVRRGLKLITECKAVEARATPPDMSDYYRVHGVWRLRSRAAEPCPVCDETHAIPAD